MKVLSVASEVFPLVKTGGLADVTGALPRALAREGIEVTTLVPGYPAVLGALETAETVLQFPDLFGASAQVLRGRAADLALLVLDVPHLFARDGNPYTDADGQDWPDNAFRFAALARAAALIGVGEIAGDRPDVLHGHDWQAGLVPVYVSSFAGRRPPTITTVHNLAFAGAFPRELMAPLGMPPHLFGIEGVEFHGAIGFLKAGLQFADAITTVSPTYAEEIQTPEAGFGLDGLLRHRASVLSGILNGIDGDVWDPATDARIPARFSREDPSPRAVNKRALQARFGLHEASEGLLCGVVSRLSWQKGLDLLPTVLPTLLEAGGQLALLGSGDAPLEAELRGLADSHPGRVGCVFGYDEDLAHLIQAGADALLVPSRFEPCGLTQLCALRYGAIPVVARVGGLADTVIDANEMARRAGVGTGVVFAPVTEEAFGAALRRTAALWADRETWAQMQRNGMAADVSWSASARRYAALYRKLVPGAEQATSRFSS